uniref:Binding protein n=1 Tax=Solanum tuberosum TaxID=4113 RepID=M1AB46_SOLTU
MTALLTFALRRQISTLNSFIGNENLREAWKLFDQSPHLTNVVSWNTFIAGCFKHSHIQQAEYLFDQMPHRDVISWNTMLSR